MLGSRLRDAYGLQSLNATLQAVKGLRSVFDLCLTHASGDNLGHHGQLGTIVSRPGCPAE